MAKTFLQKFDELPLVISPGIDGAMINVRAEIEYSRNGSWTICEIEVEAYRKISWQEREAGADPWTYIPASEALVGIIAGRLNNEWFERVQNAVDEKIEDDLESGEDNRADMKRERETV
jgi:hypothetical protein